MLNEVLCVICFLAKTSTRYDCLFWNPTCLIKSISSEVFWVIGFVRLQNVQFVRYKTILNCEEVMFIEIRMLTEQTFLLHVPLIFLFVNKILTIGYSIYYFEKYFLFFPFLLSPSFPNIFPLERSPLILLFSQYQSLACVLRTDATILITCLMLSFLRFIGFL